MDESLLTDKYITLPGKSGGKKTLVFDLDETLIHCDKDRSQEGGTILNVYFTEETIFEVSIFFRPHYKEIL